MARKKGSMGHNYDCANMVNKAIADTIFVLDFTVREMAEIVTLSFIVLVMIQSRKLIFSLLNVMLRSEMVTVFWTVQLQWLRSFTNSFYLPLAPGLSSISPQRSL